MTDVEHDEQPEAEVSEPETGDEPEQAGDGELDVDDPGDEDEPEAQAPPQEAESLARIEEVGKKFELLTKHVAKRTGEILGDDAALYEECEVCSFFGSPGWRPSIPYPDEVVAAVMHVMGRAAPSDYMRDEHSQVCAECNGFGSVASGSKVHGQDLLACVRCESKGWTPTDEKRQSPWQLAGNGASAPLAPAPELAPAGPELSDEDAAEVDALKAKGFTVIPPFVATG